VFSLRRCEIEQYLVLNARVHLRRRVAKHAVWFFFGGSIPVILRRFNASRCRTPATGFIRTAGGTLTHHTCSLHTEHCRRFGLNSGSILIAQRGAMRVGTYCGEYQGLPAAPAI